MKRKEISIALLPNGNLEKCTLPEIFDNFLPDFYADECYKLGYNLADHFFF